MLNTLLAFVPMPSYLTVLGACWGTEELGWNEGSWKKITRREIQSNGFDNYEL